MPKKRHSPEEIVTKLRQVDVLTSQERTVGEAIRAIEVTGSRVGDGPMLASLLEQTPPRSPSTQSPRMEPMTCEPVTPLSPPVRPHGRDLDPQRSTPWKETTPGAQARSDVLRASRRFGRTIWRNWSGYRRRRLIEDKMRRTKLLSEPLSARTSSRESAGLRIRAAFLNRFTALGTPETQRVA